MSMTKHLTKPIRAIHFMVLAFLMTIGAQVSALNMNTGDVMYCTSDDGAFVQGSDNFELSRWPSQKFKFQITKGKGEKKIITFGSGGFFDGTTMDIVFFLEGGSILEASSRTAKLYLIDGRLNYAVASAPLTGFFIATCDKF